VAAAPAAAAPSTPTSTTASAAAPSPAAAPSFAAIPKEKFKKKPLGEATGDVRERVNVVFVGHVDAGKSTIAGHLLWLTGMVDERTIAKFEREAKAANRGSWFLAYVMDSNEEERAKGKTVEVGKARFETDKKRYTILDAPGHKNYVSNMIGGTTQADVGILVISAKKGEFESGFDKGGQTREHAMLCKTLGVARLIVVINKMDEPSVNWDKARYDECKDKLCVFLKQVGFKPEKDVIFVPLSGLSGANIKDAVGADVCPWYAGGLSLIQTLDALPAMERSLDGPVRMPIIDKYRDQGTVVHGKLESGYFSVGDYLRMMPNNKLVEVEGIVCDEAEITQARAGDNLQVRLKGVEDTETHQGFVLCDIEDYIEPCNIFDAQIVITELIEHKPIFSAGYTAVVHIHTIVEEVSVVALIQEIDKKTGQPFPKRPNFVKSGAVVIARLQTRHPMSIEPFKIRAQLGRISLRDEGRTIAFGKVLKLKGLSSDAVIETTELN
jgi:peptide chain release factor subunit 3